MFLDSFDHKNNPIHKLTKCLLNKRPATYLLFGLDSLVFLVSEKAELIADSLENQFQLNPGP